MPDSIEYVERLYPEPVDLGIAEADRAVASVQYGTKAFLRVKEVKERPGTRAVGRPSTKPCRESRSTRQHGGWRRQGDPFEPVKIGILIDMDLNKLLADWIDPTILAIEDALNEGVWARSRCKMIIADAGDSTGENYKKVVDGFRWLVDQGCVVVLGPMISDNSLVLQSTANELGVACIG